VGIPVTAWGDARVHRGSSGKGAGADDANDGEETDFLADIENSLWHSLVSLAGLCIDPIKDIHYTHAVNIRDILSKRGT
jgi:hypothetical protein